MAYKYPRERLIQQLRMQGIRNEKVLEVMRTLPRHLFIDQALESHAYANHALPIGYGQTISQPYIVARMTEELLSQGDISKVLEIGTGCGYQTAVLANLIREVYSIERIKSLSVKASERLRQLGCNQVHLSHGDGTKGWIEHAPYQGIIVTAAPATMPSALLEQLAIAGCMIVPIGTQLEGQQLLKIVRTQPRLYEQYFLEEVSFVPLCEGIN
jgi:protein-L-isoaspartate(D-aspartate) O-methyltransferase